ncbi:MAG: uroporphyrinogen-III C-methyltransferase [Nitrospirae bacterium]|nr:uroporphyrinogen-III C-methyltransferase [Nitrospirota bacterium]
MSTPAGTVYLVGAGPGDPELITVKGRRCLDAAHVVVYDYLANPALLESLPPHVQTIYVGKRHGEHQVPQHKINELLVNFARQGATVVRLKGGDPFIFGRGGEEAQALAEAGVPFEVVPGVTAATAVTAYAGIPLTHRGMNTSVTFVTGSEDPAKPGTQIHWDALAQANGTIVFFMGMKSLPAIMDKLMAAGRAPDTPAAVIHWGTHPCQRTVTGTLASLAERVAAAGLSPPALIVVGEVVALRDHINWFENKPLFGKRVLVTRAAGQQGALAAALAAQGAEVVAAPALEIVPPEDAGPLDRAIQGLPDTQWLVLTSANGVKAFFTRLAMNGLDARALGGVKIAVVGEETARTLAAFAVFPDLVPAGQHSEGLAKALIETGVVGQTVLVAQADRARKVLVDALGDAGARVLPVVCYRSVAPDPAHPALQALAHAEPVDYATFTSGATVTNLHDALGAEAFARLLARARVAVIGPVTAEAARAAGLTVHLQAESPAIDALVATLCADAAPARRAAT